MKKILIVAVTAVLMVSCLDGSQYKATYTPVDSFEYGTLFGDSKKDSTFVPAGNFVSAGFLAFVNNKKEDGDSYARGFSLSMKHNNLGTPVEGVIDPFSVYSKIEKEGLGLPNTFVVYLDSEETFDKDAQFFPALSYPLATCSMKAMQVANTSLVVDKILNGGAFRPKSDAEGDKYPGDSLVLSVKGYNNEALTGEVRYALVDYRRKSKVDPQKDSIALGWKTMDLSKLGDIDYLDFSIDCSVPGFPEYVCIDNIVTSVYIEY